MANARALLRLLLGLVALCFLAGAKCSKCSSSDTRVAQCATADECWSEAWPLECSGAWTCDENRRCQAACTPCAVPADCEATPWPADLLRQGCTGHYECVDQLCRAVCDPFCRHAEDCVGRAWTGACESGVWECALEEGCTALCTDECESEHNGCAGARPLACDGAWQCLFGRCGATCACATDADCAGTPWPAHLLEREFPCTGHFSCRDGLCEPVCEEGCVAAADCAGRAWPLAECAVGTWTCAGTDYEPYCLAECHPAACGSDAVCGGPLRQDCPAIWVCGQAGCEQRCTAACEAAEQCAGLPWPAICTGQWECRDGVCGPRCDEGRCSYHEDCYSRVWPADCVGGWLCSPTETCFVDCNFTCTDAAQCRGPLPTGCTAFACQGGACVPDCGPECVTAADCATQGWDLPCDGHFTCDGGSCGRACDYVTCGDATCDAAGGETGSSCPADCVTSCLRPVDCSDRRWTQLCRGHWTCFAGACNQVCDAARCGNGICERDIGESHEGCGSDCLSGPCSVVADCFERAWPETCGGAWTCTTSGACSAACAAGTCSDGVCDSLHGETPATCPADCSGHACTRDADCATLTLPAGCAGGRWVCAHRACYPVCS
jgi:hypothetical protein